MKKFFPFTNAPLAGCLAVFSFVALIFATAGADLLCFKTVKKVRHTGINYDSRSSDKALTTYKELGGDSASWPLDVTIRCKIKIYSISNWNNVFQTAPGNTGLRLELSKSGELILVYGSDNATGMGGILVNPFVDFDKWYTIVIILDKHKSIKVMLDGKTTRLRSDRFLSISLSDIAVGTGYYKSRNFNGAIKDFNIQYRFFQERRWVAKLLPFLKITAAISFIVFLTLWILRRRSGISMRRFSLPDFLHPMLMAIFPILFLFSINLNEATPPDVALPLIVSLSFTGVLSLFIYSLLRDSAKTAVITTLILIGFFSAGRLFNVLAKAGLMITAREYCAVVGIGIVVPAGLIFFSRKDYSKATPFLNIFSGILIFISLLTIGRFYLKKSILPVAANNKITATVSPVTTKPDIYYIILDAYASFPVLEKYFSYDNSSFYDYLTKKGFYVAKKSTANYRSTVLSIPSSLNMKFINDLNMENMSDIFNQNTVAQFLKSQGYKFIVLNPHMVINSFNTYADVNVDCGSFRPFSSLLVKTTLLFYFADSLNILNRDKILAFFSKLSQIATIPGPKFIFAHVMCPHHPYQFGANGEFVSRTMQQPDLDDGNNTIMNKKGYLNQLRFVTKKIMNSIDEIILKSPCPPIIILQSDHGPALCATDNIPKNELPSQDYLQARFEILNAYNLPGDGNTGLYDSITPVNSFRLILNRYFQAGLPLLPDKNYYSPDGNPFCFTDITDMVNAEQ